MKTKDSVVSVFVLLVLASHAAATPTIVQTMPLGIVFRTGENVTFNLSLYFSDPDGPLSFNVSGLSNISYTLNGSNLTLGPSSWIGTERMRVIGYNSTSGVFVDQHSDVTVEDTTPPAVTSNTNNVRVANGSIVTLNATITDAGSGVKNATVNVSKINSTRNTVALTNQSGFWLAEVVADKATSGFENLQIVAYDNAGNRNDTVGMTVWVDGVAPGNITNLTNNTHVQTYINSTWDDPTDADLDHVEVYANDTFKQNVSKGTKFYNLTGLVASTQYKISVRPVDGVGNSGNWTNYSATTAAPEPTPTATATAAPPSSSSGGGSSGGSSGGGAAPASTEKYENLGPQENHEEYVPKGAMAFKFNKQDLVSEVGFNSKTNEGLVTAKVEVLKGKPTLAKINAPGDVHRYFNVLLGTSGYGASTKIEDTYVIFSVPPDWLKNFESVKLMKYKDGSWIDLATENLGSGKFKARTLGFSSFAIVGVKPAEAVVTAVATAAPQATPVETTAVTETPALVKTKAPVGFGIVLAVVGMVLAAYVVRVRRRIR